MQDAWKAMKKIRKTELQAARDLYYAYVQFEEESKVPIVKQISLTVYRSFKARLLSLASPSCSPFLAAARQTLLRRL